MGTLAMMCVVVYFWAPLQRTIDDFWLAVFDGAAFRCRRRYRLVRRRWRRFVLTLGGRGS